MLVLCRVIYTDKSSENNCKKQVEMLFFACVLFESIYICLWFRVDVERLFEFIYRVSVIIM